MTKRFLGGAMSIFLFGLLYAIVPHNSAIASADEPTKIDEALFEHGEELYQAECAVCHQTSGKGVPPSFPALNSNERLRDAALIVSNIRLGEGAMPAFPQFDAHQHAALATYVRNAWDNSFGPVGAEEVHEIVAALSDDDNEEEPSSEISIWDGIFVAEQARRGQEVNARYCAECHAGDLRGDPIMGGPPLTGSRFEQRWKGRSVYELLEYTRTMMPLGRGGTLSAREYVDIIAFVLLENEFPPSEEQLLEPESEYLQRITLEFRD